MAGVVGFAGLVAWIVAARLTAVPGQRLVDLAVYRDAGRSVLDGRLVYDHLTAAPQRLAFTYPPIAAVLSVPLAWVPFAVAGWLWTLGELVLTPVITWFGFRRLLPRFGRWWPLALGLLAGAMQQILPLRDEIKFGQVDELVVVLCLLDCVAPRGRDCARDEAARRLRWPRGVLIGLAAAIKLTPLVFIPYLWLTGRRRAAAVAVGSFVALQLLAFAVIPHDAWQFWSDSLFHTGRLQPNDGTSNQSLRGMLLRGHLSHPVLLAVWAAAWIVVAVIGYRRAAAAVLAGDEVAGVALVGLLAVLLSPVAWIHHLAWIVLAVGVLVDDARSSRRLAAAVATYLYYVLKIPWFGRHLVRNGWPLWLARPVEDGFGIGAIILLMFLPRRLRSTGERCVTSVESERHFGNAGLQRDRAHAPARAPGPGRTLRGGS